MANLDPVHQYFFLCRFRSVREAIAEGLYASRSVSTNTHWTIWSDLCANVALNPILLLHKEPIPILTTFSAKYHRGDISASHKNICPCTVEDAVCSIGQALSVMGAKDPRLNSDGNMDIQLKLQYRE